MVLGQPRSLPQRNVTWYLMPRDPTHCLRSQMRFAMFGTYVLPYPPPLSKAFIGLHLHSTDFLEADLQNDAFT